MVPSWRASLLIYFPMNIRKGTLSFHAKTTVVFWLGWALYDRDIKTLFAWFTRRFAFTRRPYIRPNAMRELALSSWPARTFAAHRIPLCVRYFNGPSHPRRSFGISTREKGDRLEIALSFDLDAQSDPDSYRLRILASASQTFAVAAFGW